MAHWTDHIRDALPFAAKALTSLESALELVPKATDRASGDAAINKVALGVHVLATVVNDLASKTAVDPELVRKAYEDLKASVAENDRRASADVDAKFG